MRIVFTSVIVLGFLTFGAEAETGIEKPIKPEYGTAGYVAKGCEVLSKGPGVGHWDNLDPNVDHQLWMCAGAIQATGQLMVMHHEYCGQVDSSNMESYKVVSRYMEKHPQDLQYSLASIIFKALQEAWPCPVVKQK